MPVVSVSMPTALLEELDALAERHDYSGRSEVVREASRSLLREFDDDRLEDRELAAIVSVRYDFGTRSVERQLTDLRHDYDDHIVSTDHSHVDDYCLELYVVECDQDRISSFVGRCRSIEAVDRVDYTLLPLDETDQLQAD